MGAAGSPWAFRLTSPAARHSSMMTTGYQLYKKKYQQKVGQRFHLISGKSVWLTRRRNRCVQVKVPSYPLENGVTINDASRAKLKGTDEWEETGKSLDASLQYPETGKDLVQMLHEWEETGKSLDASLQYPETGKDLVQMLHESAQVYRLAMERLTGPWFANAWLGIDQNAWMKSISYQAAVHALLQAALEITSRGEGREQDNFIIVQQSLLHLGQPLEDSIRCRLSSRDYAAEECIWRQQHPLAVAKFLSTLEKDLWFTAATSVDWEWLSKDPSKESDIAVISLVLRICAALMKLGPAKVSCSSFSSVLSDEMARLLNLLIKFISVNQLYIFTSSVGLKREFFSQFASRAASVISDSLLTEEEKVFWVEYFQELLKGALTRECIHGRLASHLNIEVVEQDLAVFGFFSALGRSISCFLAQRKVDGLHGSISSLFRYLEGGFVVFYPELATLTIYQLFVEVVNEELTWMPFFEDALNNSYVKKGSNEAVSKEEVEEAIFTALDVCSCWVEVFIKYSRWFQQAESVCAMKFLSYIKCQLDKCFLACSLTCCKDDSKVTVMRRAAPGVERTLKRLSEDSVSNNQEEISGKYNNYVTFDWADNLESELNGMAKSEDAILQELQEWLKLFEKPEPLGISYASVMSNISFAKSGISSGARIPGNIFSKSLKTLKNASTDALKGTQVLATDVANAVALLMRSLCGHELTKRESKILKRTFTDLASVIPISVLMLLPVTAVGHAAILAAIQKYIPALIPSAYAPERIGILKQLEQLRQMEAEPDGLHSDIAACTPDSDTVNAMPCCYKEESKLDSC